VTAALAEVAVSIPADAHLFSNDTRTTRGRGTLSGSPGAWRTWPGRPGSA